MGRLIVIEGSDGSGKATQTRKLYTRLSELERLVKRISFPNYESESSALIRMYLRGEFGGDPMKVNPYAAATFYAVDRFASWEEWRDDYERGGIILSDRYIESNMAYQAAKLTKRVERERFFKWLEDLEYNRYGLPRADLVIFLDMPPEVSAILRRERGREDIHEDDAVFMEKVYNVYRELANRYGWKVVHCSNGNFARTSTDIFEEILPIVEEILLKDREKKNKEVNV